MSGKAKPNRFAAAVKQGATPVDRNFALIAWEVTVKYKVALYRSAEGISVSVPALPGCWSEGDTEDEAMTNIRDAIREYLAALDDRVRDAEVREVEVQV